MEAPAGPAWSTAVGQADWIDARLSAFDAHQVTSVVPAGFDAYARVLHPAQEPDQDGGRLVRWADVAAWSGLPLGPGAQFHSIALPAERPRSPAPWAGQGPERGDLYLPDAEALAAITRQWTGTPEQCWFCLWDGHDLAGTVLTPPGQRGIRRPDPVPAPVRDGPRVHLPHRDYLLYAGPVEAVTAAAALSVWKVTPNLWWPADRSWCVATEIDLAWTYVGGPAGLIEAVLGDERIEAVPAEPGDPLTCTEARVTAWADRATAQLLSGGEAVITTSRGTVRARLGRPSPARRRTLHLVTEGDNGVDSSGRVNLNHRGGEELRDEISLYLGMEVIALVGG